MITLNETDKADIWFFLKDRKPDYEDCSLHICEARYAVGDNVYIAYWAISSLDEVPFQIDRV